MLMIFPKLVINVKENEVFHVGTIGPLTPILVIELFDVRGIDFIGPFVSSSGMKYILMVVY